jgi:hypothetical protein
MYDRAALRSLLADNAERLGLCEDCDMDTRNHVLIEEEGCPGTYGVYCTVLFHDAFKCKWKLKEVV